MKFLLTALAGVSAQNSFNGPVWPGAVPGRAPVQMTSYDYEYDPQFAYSQATQSAQQARLTAFGARLDQFNVLSGKDLPGSGYLRYRGFGPAVSEAALERYLSFHPNPTLEEQRTIASLRADVEYDRAYAAAYNMYTFSGMVDGADDAATLLFRKSYQYGVDSAMIGFEDAQAAYNADPSEENKEDLEDATLYYQSAKAWFDGINAQSANFITNGRFGILNDIGNLRQLQAAQIDFQIAMNEYDDAVNMKEAGPERDFAVRVAYINERALQAEVISYQLLFAPHPLASLLSTFKYAEYERLSAKAERLNSRNVARKAGFASVYDYGYDYAYFYVPPVRGATVAPVLVPAVAPVAPAIISRAWSGPAPAAVPLAPAAVPLAPAAVLRAPAAVQRLAAAPGYFSAATRPAVTVAPQVRNAAPQVRNYAASTIRAAPARTFPYQPATAARSFGAASVFPQQAQVARFAQPAAPQQRAAP